MRAALMLFLAACGRIGFADHHDSVVGDDDASVTTDGSVDAPPGTSYLVKLNSGSAGAVVAGANGKVAVAEDFQGATTIAGQAFTGHAMYNSAALLWFDGTGTAIASSVLDSTSVCSVRELGRLGDRVLGIGYTISGADMPSYGACAIATSRQDAYAIAVDSAGAQAMLGHAVSSAGNVQGWYATGFDDGSLAFAGVYDTNGHIGSSLFPSTSSDEEPFFARVDPATGEARWLSIIQGGDENFAGPMDTRGDEVCVTGGFVSSQTIFGAPLVSKGGVDQFVTRIDATGNPKFVRGYGSPGEESSTHGTSVVATADGGCTVSTSLAQPITLDTIALEAGQILVHFDAAGTTTSAVNIPVDTVIARIGDRVYAAEPNNGDIDLVSIDDATTLATIKGGALTRFAAIPPNQLAVTFLAAPPTTFQGMFLATAGDALAVLGI